MTLQKKKKERKERIKSAIKTCVHIKMCQEKLICVLYMQSL